MTPSSALVASSRMSRRGLRISARDADQLALAGGQTAAALAEPGIVARGQTLDEIVRADELGGGDHPLELAVDSAERDVLGNRAREQLHLLGHHSDLLAEHRRRPQAQIEVVEQDASALGLVQAAQQLGEGALAGAGRPGDAEHLPRRDLQIDAFERRPGIGGVAIDHALEHDMAAHPQGRAGRSGALGRLVQQLVEAGERGAHRLQLLPGADHLAHGAKGACCQNGRGDQGTDRQVAGDDGAGADVHDQEGHGLLQDLAGTRDHPTEVAGAEVARCGIGQALLEAALHLGLQAERLDRERLADGLAEAGRLGGGGLETRLDQAALAAPGEHREQPEQRHRTERDGAQPEVEIAEHHDEQPDEGQVHQQQRHLAREELADAVQLPGALQDLSGRHALEGAQRQMHQVVDDLAAERGIEAAAGVARDVAAQRPQRPFKQEQGDHAEHQHVERLERAVVDHFVVHGHQEQRGRQRQQVDHHRGGAELPQDRAQPGHDGVPARGMRRRLRQRLEQHDALGEVGDRLEAARGNPLGSRLHQDQMIVPPLGREPGVAAHPADHQKGRGRLGKIVPAWLERARLEAEPLGGQQDAADPDRAVGGGRCGPDLGRARRADPARGTAGRTRGSGGRKRVRRTLRLARARALECAAPWKRRRRRAFGRTSSWNVK